MQRSCKMDVSWAILCFLIQFTSALPTPHNANSAEANASGLVQFLGPVLLGFGFATTLILGLLRRRNGAIRLDKSNVSDASQDNHEASALSKMQGMSQGLISVLLSSKMSKHTEIEEVSRETICIEAHDGFSESLSSADGDDPKHATQLGNNKQVSSSDVSCDISSKRIEKRGSGQQKGFVRGGIVEDIFLDIPDPTTPQTTIIQTNLSRFKALK